MLSGGLGAGRLAMGLILAGVGGCATVSRTPHDGATRPAAAAPSAAERWQRARDSIAAQELALEHGPRVNVRATYTTFANQRRVRASFHASDDAYVLVGHVDAEGRLSVLFPRTPRDDGFVEGGRSYAIPEFDAGFASEYAFARSVSAYRYRPLSSRFSSYDGGVSYVFVIAGWKPMRFDRIVDDSTWSEYELTDAYTTRDPREAVDELAALIAADGPEAYTVDYAKYFRSNAYGGFSALAMANNEYCYDGINAFGGFGGYGYSSFASFRGVGFLPFALGSGWYYAPIEDPFTGCTSYHLVYGGGPFQGGVYAMPQIPTDSGSTGHGDRPWGKRPRWPIGGGGNGGGVTLASSALVPTPPRLDPRYKDRGLLTTGDEPSSRIRRPDGGGFARRVPDARIEQERPGLTEMVLRHRDGGADDAARDPRNAERGRARWTEPGARGGGTSHQWPSASGARQQPSGGSSTGRHPSPSESPRVERPHESPRYESPRSEAPRAEPVRSEPARSEPAHTPTPREPKPVPPTRDR